MEDHSFMKSEPEWFPNIESEEQLLTADLLNEAGDEDKTTAVKVEQTMEHLEYIKCEPQWQEDTKQPSSLEPDVQLPTDSLVNIKVEQDVTLDDPSVKEEIVKEEQQDVVQDIARDNKGTVLNEVQPSLSDEVSEEKRRPFSCDICQRAFFRFSDCNNHKLIHTSERTYSCDLCNRTFSKRSNLRSHLMTHTEIKPHPCNVCGKSFRAPSTLKNHVRVHTGERPFVCPICFQTFTAQSVFRSHQQVHTESRPHSCDKCDKTFRKQWTLKSHMRLHTGERPFTCNTCGKGFIRLGALKDHEKIHTASKNYSCKLCNFSSIHRFQLVRHQLVHTNEKACELCGNKFKVRSNLNVHMQTHTGIKPFSCKICERAFSQHSKLKRHLILVHNGEKTLTSRTSGEITSVP